MIDLLILIITYKIITMSTIFPSQLKNYTLNYLNVPVKAPGRMIYRMFLSKTSQNMQLINYLYFITLFRPEAYFLVNGRQAIVIPILKPEKNKFNITSYRPISLTCTFCKLLEKIVNRRLVWYLETSHKFIKHQYGFRRKHSTQDALATLHTNISESIKNKPHTILVALDLEKAYNMVWKNRVIDILSSSSVNGNLLKCLHNFLTDRTIQVKVDNVISDHTAIKIDYHKDR